MVTSSNLRSFDFIGFAILMNAEVKLHKIVSLVNPYKERMHDAHGYQPKGARASRPH